MNNPTNQHERREEEDTHTHERDVVLMVLARERLSKAEENNGPKE